MEITKDQYNRALILLGKVPEAENAVKLYENQIRWTEDPVAKIMEESKPVFIEGETIRETPLLWRATKLHYIHEKGTVERIIVYSSDPNGKELIKSTSDTIKLL